MEKTSTGSGRAQAWTLFAVFAAVFYYLPVFLIWLGYIPFEYRFYVLVVMAVVLAAVSVSFKASTKELGLGRDHLKPSLFANGIWTLVIAIILFALWFTGTMRAPTIPQWSWFFPFYVLISVPCQEFMFRSVIFAAFKRANILSALAQVLISAVTYCFLHIIYNDVLTLVATLVAGVVWGVIYYKYPNFWGVAASHALLGTLSICWGLI